MDMCRAKELIFKAKESKTLVENFKMEGVYSSTGIFLQCERGRASETNAEACRGLYRKVPTKATAFRRAGLRERDGVEYRFCRQLCISSSLPHEVDAILLSTCTHVARSVDKLDMCAG